MRAFTQRLVLVVAALVLSPALAWADDRADCACGDGTLLTGSVIAAPTFVTGKPLHGIPLTHTHIRLHSDADGQTVDLAVDDVFAAGYEPRRAEVPPPLSAIAVGQHLEACGLPYAGGMHWVHTNCGGTPTAQDPNGWLKVVDAAGVAGANLEGSQKYCYLWPRNASAADRRRRG